MSYYHEYRVDVPEGTNGVWSVERFTVSKAAADLERLRSLFGGGRGVPEGDYTRLVRSGTLVMSDTPDEIRDHISFMHRATGDVLINGLGLGVALNFILQKDDVKHVTVIEHAPEVVALVGAHWLARHGANRLEIIQADAFTWKPPKGVRYTAVWHDIWDDICTDNLPEMHKLHRRYGRRCDWQGSWCREMLEYQRRQQKQHRYW